MYLITDGSAVSGMAQSVLVSPTVDIALMQASIGVPTTPAAAPPPVPKADVAQYEGDEGDEEDEEEDGFWEEDLDDPIALADIEADAGFRL